MKHYIDTNNKTYGFDETQMDLIPADAIEIPTSISFEKYPFLSIVNGSVYYDQVAHEAKIAQIENKLRAEDTAKAEAEAKLAKLGLTIEDLKSLLG